MSDQPFGILNLNKPEGSTSRQVVDRVIRLIKPAKAGHAGTLDPMASGVLVVPVGRATRLIPYIQQGRKAYRATFLLGRRSATDDTDGDLTVVSAKPHVTREQIESLLPRLTGRIEQVPPQFSAVHVEGKRAYQLARQGQTVSLPAKTVEVHRLQLLSLHEHELTLEIECGSGCYIRSIGRDLGDRLGCGAVMSALIRTRVGSYCLETAIEPDQLSRQRLADYLLPARTAVEHLPHYECEPAELRAIRHGRPIGYRGRQSWQDDQPVAVLTCDGQLACVATYHRGKRLLRPKQVFAR